jgi:tRNA1(Val) A37 N6-methylase TrmN6
MATKRTFIDYPLQRSKFDIPVGDLLDFDADEREVFIRAFLNALSKEIEKGSMALKQRVPFQREIADYRKMLRLPIDFYLLTDNKSKKRNVLAVGAPGQTHTYRSRTHMWQMVTKQGSLAEHITAQNDALLKRLTKLFDSNRKGKEGFRKEESLVPQTIYKFMQMNYSVGAAFPPFHARFLVSRFLPKEGKAIVVDPCAGWGGRMLGTLCARRADAIRYIGVDPAKRNQDAYEELRGLYFKYLSKENKAEREADFFYAPFEKWVLGKTAKSLYGKVDLVFTSPPYFDAENYEAASSRQSANAFKTYEEWREGFYIPFIQGAFDLLKVGGYFILNVADTASAPHLERDARLIARALGFSNVGYFKLAMPSAPGTKGRAKHQVKVNDAQFKFEPVFVFQKKAGRSTQAVNFASAVEAQAPKRTGAPDSSTRATNLEWQDIRTLYKPYDKTCNH